MLDVALVAWPNHIQRWRYFQITALSLFAILTAGKHGIRYRCSAESSRDPKHQWYGEELKLFCQEHDIQLQWHEKASLGGNMNSALRMCENETILLVQDDCPLLTSLDISDGIELLLSDASVDMIRYQWAPEPRAKLEPWKKHWRRFKPSGNFYSDRPHLRRRNFMDKHGWYIAGGAHGGSEVAMTNRLRADKALILAPVQQHFMHFGRIPSVINDQRKRVFHR